MEGERWSDGSCICFEEDVLRLICRHALQHTSLEENKILWLDERVDDAWCGCGLYRCELG